MKRFLSLIISVFIIINLIGLSPEVLIKAQAAENVISISITGPDSISVNNQTAEYTAAVLPESADNKIISWSVSDSSVASINTNGVLTPITNGIVTIIAASTDGSGIFGQKTIVISGQKAFLTGLTAVSGTLYRQFSPYATNYTVYVPQNAQSVEIKPLYTGGELRYNGEIITSDVNKTFSLSGDTTEIDLNLTQTNLDAVTYTINVVKTANELVGGNIEIYNENKKLESIPQKGGQYHIKATYNNNLSSGSSVNYIVSIFSNNRLLDTKIVPYSFAPNEINTFDSIVNIPEITDSQNIDVKAMMWNDLKKITPVSQTVCNSYAIDKNYAVVLDSIYDEDNNKALVKLAFADNTEGVYTVSAFYTNEQASDFKDNSKFGYIYQYYIKDGLADLSAHAGYAANSSDTYEYSICGGTFQARNASPYNCTSYYASENSTVFFLYGGSDGNNFAVKAKAFKLSDVYDIAQRPINGLLINNQNFSSKGLGNAVIDNSGSISSLAVGVMTVGNSLPAMYCTTNNVAYLVSAKRAYNESTGKPYLQVEMINENGLHQYNSVDEPMGSTGNALTGYSGSDLEVPGYTNGTMVRYGLNENNKLIVIDNTMGTADDMKKTVSESGIYYVSAAAISNNLLGYFPYGTSVELSDGKLPAASCAFSLDKNYKIITIRNNEFAGSYLTAAQKDKAIGADDYNAIIQVQSGRIVKIFSFEKNPALTSDQEIAAVDTLDIIKVPYGTAAPETGLPDTATVTLANNIKINVPVNWDSGTPAYNGNSAGTYSFSGTLTLPTGVLNTANHKAAVTVNVINYAVVLGSSYDNNLNTARVRLAFSDNTEGVYEVSKFYMANPSNPNDERNEYAAEFANNNRFGYIYQCTITDGRVNLSAQAGYSPYFNNNSTYISGSAFRCNDRYYNASAASTAFFLYGETISGYTVIRAKAYKLEDVTDIMARPIQGLKVNNIDFSGVNVSNLVMDYSSSISSITVGVMSVGNNPPFFAPNTSDIAYLVSARRVYNIATDKRYLKVKMITEDGLKEYDSVDEPTDGYCKRITDYTGSDSEVPGYTNGTMVRYGLNYDNKLKTIDNTLGTSNDMKEQISSSGLYYVSTVTISNNMLGYFPYGTAVAMVDGKLPATNYAISLDEQYKIITIRNNDYAGSSLVTAPKNQAISNTYYNAIVQVSSGRIVRIFCFEN